MSQRINTGRPAAGKRNTKPPDRDKESPSNVHVKVTQTMADPKLQGPSWKSTK